MKKDLFFILGRERSGTTLLQNLLNNHDEIFIPNESPFIVFLFHKYSQKTEIPIEEFVDDLFKEPYFNTWEVDKSELISQLYKSTEKTFQNYCKIVLNILNVSDTQLLGDKNPTNCVFAPHIVKCFPSAKFIWLLRDYRAQVNSMLRVNFETKNTTSLAIRWKLYNMKIEKAYKSDPKKFYILKYEDLVTKPDIVVGDICNFLGVSFSKTLTINKEKGNNRVELHHKSIKSPLTDTKIQEWKKELSLKNIKICEKIAGQYGKKFNYFPSKNKSKINLDIIGLIMGYCYIPFIISFSKLPIKVKYMIIKYVFIKKVKFWKESSRNFKTDY